MTDQETREALKNRYRDKLNDFKRARRVSPCTKDYIHGRLTEIREVLILLYGDDGRQMINDIDNE